MPPTFFSEVSAANGKLSNRLLPDSSVSSLFSSSFFLFSSSIFFICSSLANNNLNILENIGLDINILKNGKISDEEYKKRVRELNNEYTTIASSYRWKKEDIINSEEYKQYFKEAKLKGRFIIAYNGLFEGDSFTEQQLIDFVNELRPDIFVIPDVWNDSIQSYRNAKYWVNVESSTT